MIIFSEKDSTLEGITLECDWFLISVMDGGIGETHTRVTNCGNTRGLPAIWRARRTTRNQNKTHKRDKHYLHLDFFIYTTLLALRDLTYKT